jgi:drug/metabolite transporter (DMT)-like permease
VSAVPAPDQASDDPGSPYPILALAVACVSTGSIFVRLAQAPALSVAFHRVFLASLLLAPFALGPLGRSWPSLSRRHRLAMLAAGVALALHFATWIASLSYTSVAASVLLVNTTPLFTLAFSRLFLGETVPAVVVGATAAAFAGATLIAAGDWTGRADSLIGAGLALAGAVTLSLYHVVGRGLRRALPLNAYVLAVWSAAATVLALLAPLLGTDVLRQEPRAYVWLVALAVVPTLCGHGLVNLSLRRLPAPTVGLFLLGEPVAASLLAFVLLDERPGLATMAGGAVVIAALAVVVRAGAR